MCLTFVDLVAELRKVFEVKDIGVFIKDFVSAIPYSSSVKLLNMEKLQFMHKLVFSDLLSQKGIKKQIT